MNIELYKIKKMNNYINPIKCLVKNFLQIITISNYIHQKVFYNLRYLDQNNNQQSQDKNEQQRKKNQKKQLNELFIYLSILIGLIVIILGGYNIYKKYVEKQVLREINRENDSYNNHHSISAASQEERNAYSFNAKVYNKYKASEIESYNEQNNSFDFNHEERMEKIRKKYGNKMIIKILIKQQIENVIYDKNMGLEYGDNCTICVNNFIDNMEIYRTPCEHIFHKDCFNKYLKKINKKNKITCPNCNQNLLINKKFLKLRQEAEEIKFKKIKIKYNKDNKNTDFENVLNINNIETDKKQILENENFSTSNADKNIKDNIKEEDNENETIPKKDNQDTIFIVKKRKINISQNMKKSATTDKKYFNIYNPNENKEINKLKKNKKEEDEIYIYNKDDNDVEIIKENININPLNSIDVGNNKKNENNLLNLNVRDKKKKLSLGKIKFSDVENEINNKNISSKEFNSNRQFVNNKLTFSDIIESQK